MSNIFQIIKPVYTYKPGAPVNEEEVKTALKKMRSRSATMNPKLSKEISDILKQVDATPGLIAQHAREFGDLEKKAVEKAREDLRREAALLVVAGTIDAKQLDALVAKYKDFSRDEVLQIIGARVRAPRTFKWSPPPGYDRVPELSSTVMDDISRNLAEVHCASLYEVIGVPENASQDAISTASDSAYESWKDKQASNPEKVPRINLIGYCKTLLLSAADRASYDKTVGNQAFKPVEEAIALIAKGSARVIDGRALQQMLKQCIDGGMGRDEAEYKIYHKAEACGVTIIESTVGGSGAGAGVMCRFCSSFVPDKATICPNCSMPVAVVCPQCGHRSVDQNERYCTHNGCGFNLYNMRRAPEALERAKQALSNGDIALATTQLNTAADAWPGMEGIAELRRRIDHINAEAGKVEAEIKRLVNDKKYFAALPLLPRLGSTAAPLAASVRSKTDAATRLVKQASTMTDAGKRIDLYMQALDLCADCVEAQTKLATTPPSSPSSLAVQAVGRSVKVRWAPLSSRFVKVTVIRKAGSQPASHNDGTVVAQDVTATEVTDVKVKAGESYFYAAYCTCGTVRSALAVAPAPAMLATDIDPSQVSMAVSLNAVAVTCVLPAGARGLKVTRPGGAVFRVNGNTFTEAGLTPDRPMQYVVAVVFADVMGNEVVSPGVPITLTATAPPQPVAISVTDGERQAQLSWGMPPAGQSVLIFVSQGEPFAQHRNDTVNVSAMKYRQLQVTGNSCVVNKDFAGTRYFLPVTIKAGLGVAGEPVAVRSLVKPQDVTIKRTDNRIDVAWNWDDTERVLLVLTTAGEQRVEFTRANCPDAKHAFVFPESTEGARVDVYNVVDNRRSEPVSRSFVLRPVELELISLKQGRSWFRPNGKFTLKLRCTSPLPCDVKVYIGEGSVPLNLAVREPNFIITAGEVPVGESYELMVLYDPVQRGVPIHFLLTPADEDAKLVVRPASLIAT